jgi:hypothetical protein
VGYHWPGAVNRTSNAPAGLAWHEREITTSVNLLE